MIQVFGIKAALGAFAAVAIALNVSVYYIAVSCLDLEWEVYKLVSMSTTVTWVLLFLLGSSYVWSAFWRGVVMRLVDSAYPSLTGEWTGQIQFEVDSKPVCLQVHARIRQSALDTIIDFQGNGFRSVSLAVTPKTLEGQHFLYYTYQAEPKNPERSSYQGTAILRVEVVKEGARDCMRMSGHYYTMRRSYGEMELLRDE